MIIIFLLCFAIGIRIVDKQQKRRRQTRKVVTVYHKPQVQTATLRQLQRQAEADARRLAQEQERRKKEAERAAKEREREEARQEKARLQKQQAEADLIFYAAQLDRIADMLSAADDDLCHIEKQIEIDKLTLSYDAETRHRKQREALLKKIMNFESRVHSIEGRIAKAKLTAEAV